MQSFFSASLVLVSAFGGVPTAAGPINQLDGLRPPFGAWRGVTDFHSEEDPALFDGVPLHIQRIFKWPGNTAFKSFELDFIHNGGIIFYSISPSNWTEAAEGKLDKWINEYAQAVKSVAPAKVMVAAGFEPDGHASEVASNKVYGSAGDYVRMYRHFIDMFAKQDVTNVVWIMDYSVKAATDSDTAGILEALWPGDEVQWLFFNVFQSAPQKNNAHHGNCTYLLDKMYSLFDNGKHNNIPWGLGAWSTMNETFSKQAIAAEDRIQCLQQVQTAFDGPDADNKYHKLQASIYFDSLNSELSSATDDPALVAAFQAFQKSSRFTANDNLGVVV